MIPLMLLRITFLLLLALLLAACGDDDDVSLETPTATNTAPGATVTSPAVATATTEVTRPDATPVPGANLLPVIAAREALAALSGRTVEEIEVVSVTSMQWSDACLGLPEADEVCAQVFTSGYEVALRLDGNVAIYRTDQGTNARLASGGVVVP